MLKTEKRRLNLSSNGRFSNERNIPVPTQGVLLDIQMPQNKPHEVLQRIKADERTKATPVVMLDLFQETRHQKMLWPGANSYIVKPSEFWRFAEAIKKPGILLVLLNQAPAKWAKYDSPLKI